MRLFPEKYRVVVWISLPLFAGFLAAGIGAYQLSRNAVQQTITTQVLPLASETAYAEIQAELARPALIAATMSTDSMVRDWLLDGEADSAPVIRYLAEVRQKHGALSAFLGSERTRKHYSAEGLRNPLQENEARDSWFFGARDAKTPLILDAGFDSADRNAMTIFVAQRILDKDGSFLGAIAIGFKSDRLARMIDSYPQRFNSRIHFIDAQRKMVPIGAAAVRDTIDALPGLRDIAREVLHKGSTPVQLQYRREGVTTHVSSRFIPELGWHLLVEQDDQAGTAAAEQLLVLNLVIGAGATALLVVLLLLTVNRYHERLERMAGSDPLTGLLNRQAFDIVFRQAMLEADRTGRPLSGILFNVDFIKQVNAMHGNAVGDEVLRTIARIARGMLRESDVVTRWNGEEFFVLLKECRLEHAVVVAERLRQEVDQHDFSSIIPDGHVTISLGVAQHEVGETASALFAHADEALYKAKVNGRNRLQVACKHGGANSGATTS